MNPLLMVLLGQMRPDRPARVTRDPPPALTLKALLDFGANTDHGLLVRAVAVPWFEIMKMLRQDPAGAHQLDWRKWEEIIAGAYTRAGFDEVILTPRSGDGGKDVIAIKRGVGSIRIFDQVKAYTPHVWSAPTRCDLCLASSPDTRTYRRGSSQLRPSSRRR